MNIRVAPILHTMVIDYPSQTGLLIIHLYRVLEELRSTTRPLIFQSIG